MLMAGATGGCMAGAFAVGGFQANTAAALRLARVASSTVSNGEIAVGTGAGLTYVISTSADDAAAV